MYRGSASIALFIAHTAHEIAGAIPVDLRDMELVTAPVSDDTSTRLSGTSKARKLCNRLASGQSDYATRSAAEPGETLDEEISLRRDLGVGNAARCPSVCASTVSGMLDGQVASHAEGVIEASRTWTRMHG